MTYVHEGLVHYLSLAGVNPEPWEVGQAFARRKGGKLSAGVSPSMKLQAYQSALREEVEQYDLPPAETRPLEVYFWFWRQIEEVRTPTGRISHSNYADSTNLQKAAEDALQGVLYTNDRSNLRVGGEIVSQSQDTKPGLVVRWRLYESHKVSLRAMTLMTSDQNTLGQVQRFDNAW